MSGNKKNITVAVGMSGGVDSSVAAALLVNEGYTVIGVTMKTYDYMEVGGAPVSESNCCDLKAVMDARAVADTLGFSHSVINVREEFDKVVITDFIDEYLRGRTPNPCVLCNRRIKWGILLQKAEELGAQYLATGHYARLRFDELQQRYILSRGTHAEKDQSYALWAVTQAALSKTLLPVGEMTKSEVRIRAEKYGLLNARKQESYEICFVPDDRYDRFLKERLPDLQKKVTGGHIVHKGKIVGNHEGYPFYTIGQRRNIGAYGQKMYVTGIESATNTITIGTDADLHHRALIAGNVNWSGRAGLHGKTYVQAKVRYKDEGADAVITQEGPDKIRVLFDRPKRAITPGQSVVAYDGDDLICGGIIETIEE